MARPIPSRTIRSAPFAAIARSCPTLLKFKHGPAWPFSMMYRGAYAGEVGVMGCTSGSMQYLLYRDFAVSRPPRMVWHILPALLARDLSSVAVMSFRAGSELAAMTTSVPLCKSSLARGSIPKTMSAPLLSTKMIALRYLWLLIVCCSIFSLKASKLSTFQGLDFKSQRACLYMSRIVPFLYSSTQAWLPQSKMFPASTPSISERSLDDSSIESNSARRSGNTFRAASFSDCLCMR
mmetsp:Transcript_8753/g.24980  ORF Transcript_8753/g.24980 Transcript_8753/m.24980 type:complete len:236 (-) Transcript_8753:1833-2540(-)